MRPDSASRAFKQTRQYALVVRSLGVQVRTCRQAQCLTLEQAAELCELDFKHLQKIEAGLLNITLVTLIRLAMGLQVPVGKLFGEDVVPRPTKRRQRGATRRRAPA